MNKQQLAAKIWESANQMRSKIEANEYKDYILGFIFYKYLSDKLVRFAQEEGSSEQEIRTFWKMIKKLLITLRATSATSFPTSTCFLLGSSTKATSMSRMFAMHYPLSTA